VVALWEALARLGARVRDSRVVAFAARWRWPLLAVLVLLSVANDRHAEPLDVTYFRHAGEHLLSGRWRTTFADPGLQAGPLFVAVYGALSRLHFSVSLVVQPLALFAVVLTVRRARRVLGLGEDARAELLAGLVLLALQVPSGAYLNGHPAQVLLPVLWVHAALDAREDRVVRAGLLLALGAAIETWALLGVPVLLALPSWRRRALATATAAVGAAATVAPFGGEYASQRLVWHVSAGAPVAHLLGTGAAFPWWLRLVQAAAAVGAGAAVWWRIREESAAVWAVPLAVVAVRLLLDPVEYDYYWIAAQTLAAVAAGVATRRAWPALLAAYVVVVEPLLGVVATVVLCLVGLSGTRGRSATGRGPAGRTAAAP
jgi:hypothetical protein